jgi:hypothetical protein
MVLRRGKLLEAGLPEYAELDRLFLAGAPA